MSATATKELPQKNALETCMAALRQVATAQLEPALDRRMLDLGERKEFLSAEEYQELLALTQFAQQRTQEKLQAKLALQQLQATFPELAGGL